MNRTAFIALAVVALLSLAPRRADLTFDLRAVSGSQITIHGPKSVAVNQNSVGGWIDFELYAFVNGENDDANDESIHIFSGNMLSTHIGQGAAGGSMVNSGEIAPRVRRGLIPPMDYLASSDGGLKNLDNDADLEIGSTGLEQYPNGGWYYNIDGMIAGRGDPFRVRNYEGDQAIAEFVLYRFTLPVESFLAVGLSDMTYIQFAPTPFATYSQWFEDGEPKTVGSGLFVNNGVLIHTAQTPEELAAIPEPGTWLLALLGMVGAGWFAKRRRH